MADNVYSSSDYLKDESYIVRFEHVEDRGWHIYTMQLTGGYGWEYILASADYIKSVDFHEVQQVEYSVIAGAPGVNLTDKFKDKSKKFSEAPELQIERGVFSIAGVSMNSRLPVKIVWFNQTSIIRFISMVNDETIVKKYAESVIRRNFLTPDAMKMGRPRNA